MHVSPVTVCFLSHGHLPPPCVIFLIQYSVAHLFSFGWTQKRKVSLSQNWSPYGFEWERNFSIYYHHDSTWSFWMHWVMMLRKKLLTFFFPFLSSRPAHLEMCACVPHALQKNKKVASKLHCCTFDQRFVGLEPTGQIRLASSKKNCRKPLSKALHPHSNAVLRLFFWGVFCLER